MADVWLNILVIALLIVVSGFFAATEIAVVSLRRSRLAELAGEHPSAALVQQFLAAPERFFAIIQIGVTVLSSAASALAGILAVRVLFPVISAVPIAWIAGLAETISVSLVVAVVSFVTLVVGELAPKSLGLRYAERIALTAARPVAWLLKIGSGVISFVSGSTNLLLKPFGDSTTFMESRISEDEFRLMLQEGAKAGVIERTEHELIESIFEFSDTQVREIMIPRPDVVALDVDAPHEAIIKSVIEQGYSRMPVYRDSIDNVIGEIYAKDIISLLEHRDLIVLHDLLRPAYFIPETKKISELMREFQARKLHLAMVIDEFGGTSGIVTLEDILEEIVGEIHDEYDEPQRQVEPLPDGSMLVNAIITIPDFTEATGIAFPEDEGYETLGGFVAHLLGRIPEVGDRTGSHGVEILVTRKSRRRITQVKVTKLSPPPPKTAGEEG
jgi:putative hemolysin